MKRIPATYVRGGTSRALMFRSADLPQNQAAWPAIFATALGSPDRLGYQLDGLGGGITSLSKVAVVDPVSRPDSDIDYLFFQVDPRSGECSTRANCGNISSAVGLFALANGWIRSTNNEVTARIHNLNSSKLIEASFKEKVNVSEMISIHGVGGVGRPVRLTFVDPGGSVAASLFPTGRRTETLALPGGKSVQATLIDATLPTVIAMASEFGIAGDEPHAALASNRALLEAVALLRTQGGLAMGLSSNAQDFKTELWNLPDVVLVSSTGRANSIRARFFSADAAHRAAPVTSSIALGSAMSLSGCITASNDTRPSSAAEDVWEIEHPSGTMQVRVKASPERDRIISASLLRTARLLMEGDILLGN
jgi:2-methylaconitate cis-trans-isomerase PrpF